MPSDMLCEDGDAHFKANSARICAAVNFAAGIPTEALTPGGLAALVEAAREAEQALQDILDPVARFRRNVPPGYDFNGVMACRLAEMPATLKDFAKEALPDLQAALSPFTAPAGEAAVESEVGDE